MDSAGSAFAETTGSGGRRTDKRLFEVEVMQRPCMHPCPVWWHVHDSELPSGRNSGVPETGAPVNADG